MLNTPNNLKGFTLVELMVAVAISSMVLAGIYSAFIMQQRSQLSEQVAVDMQQTLRAAVYLMERDIRMAGFDPTRTWGTDGINNDYPADLDTDEADEKQNDRELDGVDNDLDGDIDAADADGEALGITFAGVNSIQIAMDTDGDRIYQPAENIGYRFANLYDADGDGMADLGKGGAAPLGRAMGAGSPQPMAEDIQAVAFAYAYDYDDGVPQDSLDRQLDTSPNGNVIWVFDSDGDGLLDRVLDTNDDGVIDGNDNPGGQDLIGMAWEPGYVPLSRIRAVRIWLLARTRVPLRNYTDTATYIVGDKHIDARDTNRDGTVNASDKPDNYKRRLLTATVKCRNLGL